MDRIDMHLEVPHIPLEQLQQTQGGESSEQVRIRVAHAREQQYARQGRSNAHLKHQQIHEFCAINETDTQFLHQAINKLGLSARAYHRILKLARTIADLSNCQSIQSSHISEAIAYRRLDRN